MGRMKRQNKQHYFTYKISVKKSVTHNNFHVNLVKIINLAELTTYNLKPPLTSKRWFRNSLFLPTDSVRRDSRDAIFSSRTSTLLFRVSSSIDSRALYRLWKTKKTYFFGMKLYLRKAAYNNNLLIMICKATTEKQLSTLFFVFFNLQKTYFNSQYN